MNDRLTELLPWYVNGTLDDADRAWVDAYLRDHPEARSELQWYQELSENLRGAPVTVSDEIGLERTLARIRTDASRAPAQSARAPRSSAAAPGAPARARAARSRGLFDRVREFLDGFGLTPAMAGAMAIVLVQAGVIATMLAQNRPEESTEIRASMPRIVEPGPFLKINFKPDTREADIRLLLVGVQGSLAGGPGQLGDYYVRVPAAGIEQAAASLRNDARIEAVAVVDSLPPRP